ncbi:cupin [Stutzerimonas urumqiensis]
MRQREASETVIAERINAELQERAIAHGARLPWLPSPLAGVERRPLYRLGGEQARATSLVRYRPGSHFSAHEHGGGEEILVLEGVFEDEHGRYPAGSYLRNPPGSRHTPGSTNGCVIFVRLRQFHPDDREQCVISLQAAGSQPLFENIHERVGIEAVAPEGPIIHPNPRGLELLMLEGNLVGADVALAPWSWMRLPAGEPLKAQAGAGGARFWLKDAAPELGL